MLPRLATDDTEAPFISQSARLPAPSRQTMSLSPSRFTSWESVKAPLASVVAEAHAEGALPLLLSVNTTAGDVPRLAFGEFAKLRLFVSPVKPCPSQDGALGVPESTAVRTTIVVPLLKFA